METPILEETAEEVGGIFTVHPECPIYQDPFYANDTTVIASFPFDHDCLDREILKHCVRLIFFITASFFTHFVAPHLHFLILIYAIFYIPADMYTIGHLRSKKRERQCTHIAVATTGIYVDKVSASDSRVVLRRQQFLYENYQDCYVSPMPLAGSLAMEYTIMLKKRNSLDPPFVLVQGLLGTQVFADHVNRKMEQVANSMEAQQSPMPEDSTTGNYSGFANIATVADGNAWKMIDPDGPFVPDPFYATDDTVLAALAFDHSRMDRWIWFWQSVQVLLVVVFFLSTWFVEQYENVTLVLVTVFSFLGLMMGNPILVVFENSHQKSRCTHVAIAKTGIYLDYVSAPGSRIHMCRTIYLYEDIQYCYLEKPSSVFCGSVKDQVKIKKKNSACSFDLVLRTVVEPQLFVEKVNALVGELAAHTTKNSANASATIV